MLVDLRSKYPDLTGKVAEKALVSADITVNKNMVPFDSRSAFQTSGIRLGTPAITTRGAKEDLMLDIAEMIETVLSNVDNEEVIAQCVHVSIRPWRNIRFSHTKKSDE